MTKEKTTATAFVPVIEREIRMVCFDEQANVLCGPEHRDYQALNECRARDPKNKERQIFAIEVLPKYRPEKDSWTGYGEVLWNPNHGYREIPSS